MAKINLLPWREEYRQERKKEFISHLVAVCLFAFVIAFVWLSFVNNAISNQNSRNVMLKNEISALDEKVKEIQELKRRREELIARMKVIQDLQGTRPTIVHYFDEFVRALPKGVHVDLAERTGNVLKVEGIAESNNRVSAFMRNLNDSEWFADPDLKTITTAPDFGGQSVKFTLLLKTILPKADGASSADNGGA